MTAHFHTRHAMEALEFHCNEDKSKSFQVDVAYGETIPSFFMKEGPNYRFSEPVIWPLVKLG